MSEDNFEGAVRSTLGKAEKVVGEVSQDTSTVSQGRHDEAAGKAQSAVGSVKDAISSTADAMSSVDFSSLRDEVVKLTQTVSDMMQKQASSAGTQMMDAVGFRRTGQVDIAGVGGRFQHTEEPVARGGHRRCGGTPHRQADLSIASSG